MGNLLKETLKTLCGVNQWSYAVFWKIGCQHPKLLIWEECYCVPCSGLPRISRYENLEITFQDYDASWMSAENCNSQTSVQAGNKVHFLINKMMLGNRVNIAGEGLVGRAAFTGNHQWILSENYHGEGHPPKVLKEVFQQFSAGMQTVAVIPVLPHGVIQFGSDLSIKENMGFVNDVTSLVLHLGYIPGSLLSDNYVQKELTPRIGVQESLGISTAGDLSLESNMINASPFIADSFNYARSSSLTPVFNNQTSCSVASTIPTDLQSNFTVFQASNSSGSDPKPHDYHQDAKISPVVKLDFPSSNSVMNGMAKAEVIPSNPGIWMNQYSSSCPSISNHDSLRCIEQKFLLDTASQDHFSKPSVSTGIAMSAPRTNSGLISSSNEDSVTPQSVVVNSRLSSLSSSMKSLSGAVTVSGANRAACEYIASKQQNSAGFRNANLSELEAPFSDSADHLTPSSWPSSSSKYHHKDNKFAKSELNACKEETVYDSVPHANPRSLFNENLNIVELIPSFVEGQSYSVKNTNYKVACAQPQSGEDLFDIFGADFKNKLFSYNRNNCLSNVTSPNAYNRDDNMKSQAISEMYSISEGLSDSGIFSWTGTDNLLDAVVSKVHPSAKKSLDDNVSCRTTLTDTSSFSAPNASLFYERFGVADHVKGELLGIPKYLAKDGSVHACSMRNGSTNEDSGTYSQGSSFYGSQISSWIEKGHNSKKNNNVSSGYPKKPNETSKTSRKRLKPGENPKPRPKDRQMIQDRVKELREIVPNGAKCSIDALLERTIKHMLFLQSVTKHADKLKQAGESKIISEDGGLLLKDNFEGGATWAYEVGSQSMICPIIVEDLNQPRQMLVEMLCEERGMFLEIADVIRGMGLTILKGIMETQSDKIWARFAVEANRDVTRMEIFISLVRLLEQCGKSGNTPPNGISPDSLMVQQFQQTDASVPKTGCCEKTRNETCQTYHAYLVLIKVYKSDSEK